LATGLVFDERDSGEPGSPVTWRACRKERPVFDGGWRVPELKPVTDQSVLARIPALSISYYDPRIKAYKTVTAGGTRLVYVPPTD
jgi:hypothetical protein